MLINLTEFSGESKLSYVSKITTIVLMVIYGLFFLSYPVYRCCLQKYFTVQTLKGPKAAARARSD